MALSYLKLFYSFRGDIELLTMEERGRLLTAMLEYAETGVDPSASLTGNERILFPMCRQRIDRDVESYNRQVEAGRANGIKGGRPKKTPGVISKPPITQDKEKEKEEEHDKEEGEGEETRAASPTPTLSEVVEFCRKEAPSVDGERFYHHYQAVGWRAGNRPITDWRAKLREWERENATRRAPVAGSGPSAGGGGSPKNTNPALNYAQRDPYSEEQTQSFYEWFENWDGIS